MKVIPSDLLRFQEEQSTNDTYVVTVLAKAKGLPLGEIRWHVPFRSYSFAPRPDTMFSQRVLADITTQLIAMMDDWARAAGRKPTHGKSSPYRPRQKRCGAVAFGTQMVCGRWLGHAGPHCLMGSDVTWEG